MSETQPYTSLWVYLDVSHTDRIQQIRDILYTAVDHTSYSLITNPHITLHRGFQIPNSELSYFLSNTPGESLIDTTATVTGIKLWPSINTPHVVMLDLDMRLEPAKSQLNSAIESRGGTAFHDPVPPHLTLFQTGLHHETGAYGILTESECDRLFALKNSIEFPWEITVTDITFGLYEPHPG